MAVAARGRAAIGRWTPPGVPRPSTSMAGPSLVAIGRSPTGVLSMAFSVISVSIVRKEKMGPRVNRSFVLGPDAKLMTHVNSAKRTELC
jgi:hypothetical protein